MDNGQEVADGWLALICDPYSWPCDWAVATALCESGDDFLAPWDGYHVGSFQLYPGHAWRFAARGWDYWTDGNVPERNIAIAFEVWQEQGATPWPVCGQVVTP